MQLPIFQDDNRNFMMFQTRWASIIQQIINQPINAGDILQGVALINGVTIINHLLGRTMQGWSIVDVNGAATIYKSQPFNDKTLTLTSNAAVTVNILVF